MKYFEVEKIEMVGHFVSGYVDCDGEYVELPQDLYGEESKFIEYVVNEFDETGKSIGRKHYENEDTALDEIEKDHPVGEWQNNNW